MPHPLNVHPGTKVSPGPQLAARDDTEPNEALGTRVLTRPPLPTATTDSLALTLKHTSQPDHASAPGLNIEAASDIATTTSLSPTVTPHDFWRTSPRAQDYRNRVTADDWLSARGVSFLQQQRTRRSSDDANAANTDNSTDADRSAGPHEPGCAVQTANQLCWRDLDDVFGGVELDEDDIVVGHIEDISMSDLNNDDEYEHEREHNGDATVVAQGRDSIGVGGISTALRRRGSRMSVAANRIRRSSFAEIGRVVACVKARI